MVLNVSLNKQSIFLIYNCRPLKELSSSKFCKALKRKVKKKSLDVTTLKFNFFTAFFKVLQSLNSKTRSSGPEVFCKKGVLKNFTKFHKTPVPESLFNRVAGLKSVNLLKRLRHEWFPVNSAKYLRTPFLQNTSGRLPLKNGTDTGIVSKFHL